MLLFRTILELKMCDLPPLSVFVWIFYQVLLTDDFIEEMIVDTEELAHPDEVKTVNIFVEILILQSPRNDLLDLW